MYIGLIINMVYAKAIGVTQGIMAREVGSDMWIATLFATGQGMLVIFLLSKLILRKPDCGLIEHSEWLLGKWIGKLVALIVFLFFLGATGPVMVTFVYHLKDYFLPEAPTVIFVLVGFMVGMYGCYKGIEVMGRMAFVGLFSIMALNILLLLGSLREFDIRNLMPVLDSGVVQNLWASRQHNTDWAMATMMAGLILPMVKRQQVWSRTSVVGIALGGFFVVMWPILEAGVLSAHVTAEYIVSCMQMARSAHIGHFIHRYEMIMVAFFSTSALIQIMVCIFGAAHAASKIMGSPDYKKFILPVSVILASFGYWLVLDQIRAVDFTKAIWPMIAMPIAFGLPIGLLIIGFFIKRNGTDKKKHPPDVADG